MERKNKQKVGVILNKEQLGKKPIFIFGGLGFIGNRLALELSQSHEVHVVDNSICNSAKPEPELIQRSKNLTSHGVIVHNLDIFETQAMSDLLAKKSIDTVFHLAGASSVKSTYSGEGFKEVVGITNQLLNQLSTAQVDRIVYFSSSMVYGDFCHSSINESHSKKPVDRYGALKYASEILVNSWAKETDTVSIILRPTAVYGPNDIKQRIVSKLINQASIGNDLTITGDGENRLDFTYIDDVIAASKATLDHSDSDEFNISFGQSRSLNELTTLIKAAYPNIKISHNYSEGYPTAKRGQLNSEKAIRLLGYDPQFSLEHGLSLILSADGTTENFSTLTNMNVPLAKADVLSSDFDLVNQTLQTGWYTSGPQNHTFEQNFLHYHGQNASHALSVNSCASALELALLAHGISGGVVVPAFTFSATANSVIRAGAYPQFADIEPNYLGLDPEKLEQTITEETQAILVVHLAGVICDIDAIMDIAEKHNLVVIEDCAQALAAQYKGQKAGTFGNTACFSFFPTKMITTGEGGMLITKHTEVFHRAKALANHGYNSSTKEREQQVMPWLREQVEPGSNFRMSSINAALGISQLNRLDNISSNRRNKALTIIDEIEKFRSIKVFKYTDRHSVYQALNILVPLIWNRDEFTLMLRKKGVMASVHYPEILPESKVFRKYCTSRDSFTQAQDISNRIVTLPLFGAMTKLQMQHIFDALEIAVDHFHSLAENAKAEINQVATMS